MSVSEVIASLVCHAKVANKHLEFIMIYLHPKGTTLSQWFMLSLRNKFKVYLFLGFICANDFSLMVEYWAGALNLNGVVFGQSRTLTTNYTCNILDLDQKWKKILRISMRFISKNEYFLNFGGSKKSRWMDRYRVSHRANARHTHRHTHHEDLIRIE